MTGSRPACSRRRDRSGWRAWRRRCAWAWTRTPRWRWRRRATRTGSPSSTSEARAATASSIAAARRQAGDPLRIQVTSDRAFTLEVRVDGQAGRRFAVAAGVTELTVD